jgi:hypothetical protein
MKSFSTYVPGASPLPGLTWRQGILILAMDEDDKTRISTEEINRSTTKQRVNIHL